MDNNADHQCYYLLMFKHRHLTFITSSYLLSLTQVDNSEAPSENQTY